MWGIIFFLFLLKFASFNSKKDQPQAFLTWSRRPTRNWQKGELVYKHVTSKIVASDINPRDFVLLTAFCEKSQDGREMKLANLHFSFKLIKRQLNLNCHFSTRHLFIFPRLISPTDKLTKISGEFTRNSVPPPQLYIIIFPSYVSAELSAPISLNWIF